MLKHKEDNQQFLAAVFGDVTFQKRADVMKGETAFEPTLDQEGKIRWTEANP